MSTLSARVKSLEHSFGMDASTTLVVVQEDQLDQIKGAKDFAQVVVDPRTGRRVRPVYIISDFPEAKT